MNSLLKKKELLGSLSFFSSLTDVQLNRLAEHSILSKKSRGEIIFTEGDKANGFYFISSGQVKIYRMGQDGREAVLHILGVGEPFGEVAVFQGTHFPASAQSLSSGECLFLPRGEFVACLESDPDLAMKMLAALSLRLRQFAHKIESLTLLETPQRLAAYLLHESLVRETDTITLDISKALLAGMLGSARETLSRALSKFVEDEAIIMENRNVRIINKTYLKNIVKRVETL